MSSIDTPESTLQTGTDETGAVEAAHDHNHEGHDHGEEGHDHSHDQEHVHQHGPVLNPECTRELVLDIPAEDVSKAYRRVTASYRRVAKIPGFRVGKVPETVIKQRFFGEIRKEVIDSILPDRFNQAVLDLGVKPVGQPQVIELTVDDGAPLHVKAAFEYVPEFSIEGYQSVVVEKPSIEATEEEYQQELDRLRESTSTIEPVEEDRTLVDGDWAQISYKGQVVGDGEAAPVAGENTLIEIGGKDTVEAFTTALRGAKAGQELKVEVIYPAEYAEPKLAGKTVAYDVEVQGIKKRVVPELDDDFAKEMGEYENFAELEKRLRERLSLRKKRSVENETREKLFAALNERFTFPVPESMVQEQIDTRLERGLRALAAQGMDTEQMRKLDFARLRAVQREGAAAEVKTSILLDSIASEEKITITDEELEHELQIASVQSSEPIETLRERLTQGGEMTKIREQMRREKTAHVLYERLPA